MSEHPTSRIDRAEGPSAPAHDHPTQVIPPTPAPSRRGDVPTAPTRQAGAAEPSYAAPAYAGPAYAGPADGPQSSRTATLADRDVEGTRTGVPSPGLAPDGGPGSGAAFGSGH